MKKRQVVRLANKTIAAAVLFLQAVFLLAPAGFASAQSALTIQFNPYPPSVTSGDLIISVVTNFADASVDFIVTGPQSLYYPTVTHDSASFNYSFTWQASAFPAGTYQVRAQASRAGEAPFITATIAVASSPGDAIAPSVPTGLAATALAYNYVTLNWQASIDNVAVDHYLIYRNAGGVWSQIAQSAGVSYTDGAVAAGSSYTYKIIALDAAGNQSGPSNEVFLNVPTAPAPNPPANLQAAQSGSSINLNWTNSAGATHYAVQRSVNGAAYVALTTNTPVNYYTDATVMAGSNYAYRVYACSGVGCSPTASISNNLLVSSSAGSSSSPAVIAPSNLTYTVNGSSVTLNWTDNSDNESGFKIYRGPVWTDIGNVGSNVTTKTDFSLPAGTYKYKVQAFLNISGASPVYSSVSNETSYIAIGSASTSSAAQTTTPTPSPDYVINFFQPPSVLYASSSIMAETNFPADEVRFYVAGNTNYFIGAPEPTSQSGVYRYGFKWDITSVINGTYSLNAVAARSGLYYSAPTVSILVSKPAVQIDLAAKTPTTTQPIATTTIVKQPATVGFYQPAGGATVAGYIKIIAQSYGPIGKVEIARTKDGAPISLGFALLDSSGYRWQLGWDTKTVADGYYDLSVSGWDDKNNLISGNKITVKIANQPQPTGGNQVPTTTTVKPPSEPVPYQPPAAPTQIPAAPSVPETPDQPPLPEVKLNELLDARPQPIDERCLANGITDPLKCGNFLSTTKTFNYGQAGTPSALPQECQNAGLSDPRACELFMRTEYSTFDCKQAGVATKAECRAYMQNRYGRPTACGQLSDAACLKLMSQVILSDFVDQNTIDQANREIKNLAGRYLEIKRPENGNASEIVIREDTATLPRVDSSLDRNDAKTIEQLLPLNASENNLNLMVLESSAEAARSKVLTAGSVLLDSDADGLPDEMEKRLGTDPFNADSDHDGFSDGVEVKSGHNPLGAGDYDRLLQPIEKAIVNKAKLEQPKITGTTRSDILTVKKIVNKTVAGSTAQGKEKSGIKLQGRALPNEIATVYIYSIMPIVVTVATDDNGNWTYDLDKSLTNGKHEAYVVINDEEGKIKAKSAPFSFFIKEAKAVSQNEFLGADFNVPDRTRELTGWYIAGGLLLVLLGLGGYLLFQKTKDRYTIN